MQQGKDIHTYIREKRLKQGLSLNEFCFNNEIEPATLSRYENGKRKISLHNLSKIANGFNQTPGEFLTEFEQNQIND